MSEMFDLNFISAAYNRFGESLQRIYNNNNEIIWETDSSVKDYLWVERVESGKPGYIYFTNANAGMELETDAIMYSWDQQTWDYMTYIPAISRYGVRLNHVGRIYFKYTKSYFQDIRIFGGYFNQHMNVKLKCKIGGSLHKFVNEKYFFSGYNLFGTGQADELGTAFFSGLDITDARELKLDYYNVNIPEYGYRGMFYKQHNLEYAPENIGDYNSYIHHYGCANMFDGCVKLRVAPILNTGILYDRAYSEMFSLCEILPLVECYAHTFNILTGEEENFNPFYLWGLGNSQYSRHGVFYKFKNIVLPGNPIPYFWNIHEIDMPN